jgi:hypothetical protein
MQMQMTGTLGFDAPTLVPWTPEDGRRFERQPLRASHRAHETGWFTKEALIDLLGSYPRHRLQAFTMGTDLARNREDWQPVDTTGASGAELYAAMERGRIWFNVLQVHVVDRRFKELMDKLYEGLAMHSPGFETYGRSATLIISSPGALVYYHADAQPNLLWQLMGTKRIWVYPSGDRTLIQQELMEDIFASYMDEEVPYQPTFDAKAQAFDLHPGEVLSWPQNSPHRVTNLEGVNVSLSTVHETEASDRRKLIYCANRLFRRSYHLPTRSTVEAGASAYLKRFVYRAFRKAGLVKTPSRRAYLAKYRIDPLATNGYSLVPDGPVLTEFSRKDFRLERDSAGHVSVVPIVAT